MQVMSVIIMSDNVVPIQYETHVNREIQAGVCRDTWLLVFV